MTGASPWANVDTVANKIRMIDRTDEVIFLRRRLLWKLTHQSKEQVGFRFGSARLRKTARQFHHNVPAQANRQRSLASGPPRYRRRVKSILQEKSPGHFAES